MTFSLGVIGLGRMATAIISPLIRGGEINPKDVLGVVGSHDSVQSTIDLFSSPTSSLRQIL